MIYNLVIVSGKTCNRISDNIYIYGIWCHTDFLLDLKDSYSFQIWVSWNWITYVTQTASRLNIMILVIYIWGADLVPLHFSWRNLANGQWLLGQLCLRRFSNIILNLQLVFWRNLKTYVLLTTYASSKYNLSSLKLCEMCPNTEFSSVRISPHSEWIRRDRK